MILTNPISILYRLTFWSYLLSITLYIFPYLFSPLLKDIIKSLSLLIAVAVVYVYIVYGSSQIRKFYSYFIGDSYPPIIYYLLDIIIHFLPVLLNGLPLQVNGLFYGYIIIILWYISVRSIIQKLYFENLTLKEYDFIIFIYLFIIILLYVIINQK